MTESVSVTCQPQLLRADTQRGTFPTEIKQFLLKRINMTSDLTEDAEEQVSLEHSGAEVGQKHI